MKTQSLILGSGPNVHARSKAGLIDAQPSFSIVDQDIEMITNTRYSGVQIDRKPNWNKHIDTIKTKANRAIGLIEHLRVLWCR